ncbi:hypothetical protein [Acinetobacter baumannii]|uniref:hypothetical protein n=1 Tax=Acinetobacter baumannii TaxID=470 RepID=UPI00287066E9|nr:hypothetical protein [Acinetobacter baumannii]MDR9624144.1 hypothetical protein [Acinetobacter baumannii]
MIIKRKRVVIHELYWDDEYDQDELKQAAAIFTRYWLDGYAYDFGRDKPIYRPDSIQNAALCHVHYLNHSLYGQIGRAWQRNCKPSIAPYFRSHHSACDAMFLYAVSEEGTALLLAFLEADAHAFIKQEEVMRAFAKIVIEKFKELDEQPALPKDLQSFLQTPTPQIRVVKKQT